MATWLVSDLASTTATWIICLFHHPPYTKGSHNSDSLTDSAGAMVEMRPGPDLAPGMARDQIDEVGVERILARDRFIDPGVAQHPLPQERLPQRDQAQTQLAAVFHPSGPETLLAAESIKSSLEATA